MTFCDYYLFLSHITNHIFYISIESYVSHFDQRWEGAPLLTTITSRLKCAGTRAVGTGCGSTLPVEALRTWGSS